MTSRAQRTLEERVIRAAEAALTHHQFVSALDIFVGMGLLAPADVREWRNGRVPYLERVIQGNLRKISRSMHVFRVWARERGLKPGETAYLARTRGPRRELRFSKSGDPGIEQALPHALRVTGAPQEEAGTTPGRASALLRRW